MYINMCLVLLPAEIYLEASETGCVCKSEAAVWGALGEASFEFARAERLAGQTASRPAS